MVLNVTLETEPGADWQKKLLDALAQCKDLEQVQIVANPTLQFFMEVQNPRHGVMGKTFPGSAAEIEGLAKRLEKLKVFKVDVLRTNSYGGVEWEKGEDGKWTGGVKEGKGVQAGAGPGGAGDGKPIEGPSRP